MTNLGFFFAEFTIGPMWAIPMDITPQFSGSASGLMNIGSPARRHRCASGVRKRDGQDRELDSSVSRQHFDTAGWIDRGVLDEAGEEVPDIAAPLFACPDCCVQRAKECVASPLS